MTLIEIVDNLDCYDPEGIICAAKPWTEMSPAIVVVEPQARRLPKAADKLGMDYFLEVFIARDFLEGWRASLDSELTLQQKCTRLITYAIMDA